MSIITKIKNRSRWLMSYPVYWYTRATFKNPEVKGMEETIKRIIEINGSASRYGDGELEIMVGRSIDFQKYEPELAQKMRDILQLDDENFLVCINDAFRGCPECNEQSRAFWKENLRKNLKYYKKLLKKGKVYYDACITRPYMRYTDKSKSPYYFSLLKQIWQDRDIVFIEGEKSRLGVGNDLFDNAKSIRRILCPAESAFSYYNEIIDEAAKLEKDVLFLIALGPTATAMAYDIYKLGYQAVDIGHIDIEYEWMRMGATEKVAIPNKYTNEAVDTDGMVLSDIYDKEYLSQIIANIG